MLGDFALMLRDNVPRSMSMGQKSP